MPDFLASVMLATLVSSERQFFKFTRKFMNMLNRDAQKACSFASNITSIARSVFLGQSTLCCKSVFSDNTVKNVPCTVFS